MEKNDILIETSVLIELQRKNPIFIDQFKNISKPVLSRVTINEFIFGSRNKRELQINKGFLTQFPIIEINEEISKLSYILIDQHCLSTGIGLADALIAATAIHLQIPLWTVDHKHLSRIKPLKLHKF